MTSKQRLVLFCGVILLGALLMSNWSLPAQAGLLPPPRATLTPTPHATQTPTGTYIELRLPTNNIDLWTVVQWQDGVGNWHDVDSWRGVLDQINDHKGDKIWWVLPYSYGDGPMRWLVYDRAGGKLLATSHSFYLPGANQHVTVEVSLK